MNLCNKPFLNNKTIIFCHLLNDNSGSPQVLNCTIQAVDFIDQKMLFVGSHGKGVLESNTIEKKRYWYRRSQYRFVTFFNYIRSQISLYRALNEIKTLPDDTVVYINTLLPFGGMIWGYLKKKKVIVHVHEISISPKILRKFLCFCAAHLANKLIYVSKTHLSHFSISDEISTVLYNPINQNLMLASSFFHYKPRRSGLFEVLMLSSARDYKGLPEFFKLANMLINEKDIRFILVLNVEEKEINEIKEKNTISDNVKVYAKTNNPEIFYKKADVVLNLSRVDKWIETFGLTIVEAMSFGIPVIGPPIGGPAEIIEDGRNGFCIDSRQITEISLLLKQLATQPEFTMKISQNAKRRSQDFSFQIYREKLANLFSKITAIGD